MDLLSVHDMFKGEEEVEIGDTADGKVERGKFFHLSALDLCLFGLGRPCLH